MHFVIPGRPGLTLVHSRFPGMKKQAQECKHIHEILREAADASDSVADVSNGTV